MIQLLAAILDNLGPQYTFAGGNDLRIGILVFIPAAAVTLIAAIIWAFSTFSKKSNFKGGWRRFALWILLKFGIVGIIISIVYFVIAGVKFLIAKF